MCTAVTYQTDHFYFGRTLDETISYGGEIVVTPRRYPLDFRFGGRLESHYAMIGVACVADGYPLYFDGVNEKGLAMAGLNFSGYAEYGEPVPGQENVAQFELIPWILSRFDSVKEAAKALAKICITGTPFSSTIPPAQLHWILSDREETITLESVREGIRIYPNPVGVLANNPPFDAQMLHLSDYMHLSPWPPENRFSRDLDLEPYSLGLGAMGLPGDLSSRSRFVRAAFVKLNAVSGTSEEDSVNQFFHILEAVGQPRGCTRLEDGSCEITQYASCCDTNRGIYYYTTYENHRITAVDMHRCLLGGRDLIRYPLIRRESIFLQNG